MRLAAVHQRHCNAATDRSTLLRASQQIQAVLHPSLTMTALDWLKLAYAANVVILVPVALPTLLGLYDTTQGTIPESSGYRSLVGSLWTSILVASVLGMWAPLRYVPVLMMQVIYKSLWLLLYGLPTLRRKKPVPLGITISFAAIVLLWPWLIPWHLLIRD